MRISVIIPVRNEANSITRLLDGLTNQTLLPAEIVITDSGSTDGTVAKIQSCEQTRVPIRLIRATNSLPGRGRNLAAAQAAHEWLAFIDAGITPERNWLESLAARADSNNDVDVDVVYGSYEPLTEKLYQRCSAMAYLSPPREIEGKLVRSRSVASVLMKRSVWQSVGGFPEDLRSAEDLLFMNKIDAANFRIAYAPDARVHWQLPKNLWGTFRRFVTYARNNMRAGLWREWQRAIFQRYTILVFTALPVFIFGPRWLLVTLLLWLAMLMARAGVAIWRNRFCYPGGVLENFVRLLVIVPLIAVLDAATFIGTLQWAVKDKSGR